MMKSRAGHLLRAVIVAAALALAAPALASQPPTTAAQEGFVPVSRTAQQETIPAARLVVIAYGFAWVMLLGYLWSIWSRLGKVERELHAVSRRIDAGERRA
jgi:CcmD family protein